MRLLLAEDEKELSNALCAILRHHNYSVDIVDNGQDALDYGLSENYDGIILDIMMPKIDGVTVLRRLRTKNVTTPIMMLTAKSELDDRILGLDFGADDYLGKPFAMKELLARLRAITRRKSGFSPNLLSIGNITLNCSTFEMSNGETSIRLGNKEFQLMDILMNSPNRWISTDQFMEMVWGYDSETDSNVVWVYISYLRKKLIALDANVEIKTLRNKGYRLEVRT